MNLQTIVYLMEKDERLKSIAVEARSINIIPFSLMILRFSSVLVQWSGLKNSLNGKCGLYQTLKIGNIFSHISVNGSWLVKNVPVGEKIQRLSIVS